MLNVIAFISSMLKFNIDQSHGWLPFKIFKYKMQWQKIKLPNFIIYFQDNDKWINTLSLKKHGHRGIIELTSDLTWLEPCSISALSSSSSRWKCRRETTHLNNFNLFSILWIHSWRWMAYRYEVTVVTSNRLMRNGSTASSKGWNHSRNGTIRWIIVRIVSGSIWQYIVMSLKEKLKFFYRMPLK